MVLPSSLLESQKHSSVGCVEIIEFLTQSGFKIQGLKMVTLSVGVVRELLALCNCLDTVMVNEGVCVCVFMPLTQWYYRNYGVEKETYNYTCPQRLITYATDLV